MRYKVIVSYDGTNYDGWQSQPSLNTIQDNIEQAISKINNKKTSIVGAGRTDAGVHALGMVFHFDSDRDIPCWKWKMGINSNLNKDIRIQDVSIVDDNFHARFNSKIKTYQYTIDLKGNNPFTRLYAYSTYKQLDIDKMKQASQIFIGTHDFTSLNASPLDMNQVRTINSIDFVLDGDLLKIIFSGPGFLRFQVRMMVGCLIEVGCGNLSYEELQQILNSKTRGSCRYKASANGLCLINIDYQD